MECSERRKKREKERKVEKKKKKGEQPTGEKESDLTRLIGLSHVCLFTKMPRKLSFDYLKILKMCFQFP